MLPSAVQETLERASGVESGLRDAAGYCTDDQTPLQMRLLQAAQTINELVSLVEQQTQIAKWNHDAIIGRNT